MDGIKTVSFVGMGCLGLMFGNRIAENIGFENVSFLMDAERYQRHKGDRYTVNGEERLFQIRAGADIRPVNLLFFATKYGGLAEAIELARPAVREDTIIVSLLNGIISESIIAESFDREQIVDSVSLGMDCVREGTDVVYTNLGHFEIGAHTEKQAENVAKLKAFFDRAGVPCDVVEEIDHAMWNKFMINVGVNQSCMVYRTNYGITSSEGQAKEDMLAAMREVMMLAELEGVTLTEEDLQKDLKLLASLDKDKYPSMQQDALAKRKSEVELFAGTMLKIAEKHGVQVPVNRRYYDTILAMEAAY